MALQWHYQSWADLGILAVAGSLSASSAGKFSGAIGWAEARGSGPLILDLGALTSWTTIGQGAVVMAALRLAEHGRTMEIASIPADAEVVVGNTAVPIRVHADLDTALAALGFGERDAEGRREWRSGGWADRPAR